jgi:hypothetical protein
MWQDDIAFVSPKKSSTIICVPWEEFISRNRNAEDVG